MRRDKKRGKQERAFPIGITINFPSEILVADLTMDGKKLFSFLSRHVFLFFSFCLKSSRGGYIDSVGRSVKPNGTTTNESTSQGYVCVSLLYTDGIRSKAQLGYYIFEAEDGK